MKILILLILTMLLTKTISFSQCNVDGVVLDAYLLDPNSGTNNFDTDGNGTAADTDEFIQLCNTTGSAVSLAGWTMNDPGTGDFSLSGTIPAGECVLIISNWEGTPPSNVIDLDRASAFINNNGDNVTISNTTNTNSCTYILGNDTDGCVNIYNNPGQTTDCNITPAELAMMPLLPVQFSKFNAEAKNKTTNISFSTASEVNNDYFTIERSADGNGKTFETIGEINGAGNSNEEINYEFVDEKPMTGINYYRIKQTDYDGLYSYSEIKSVRHKGFNNLSVTPRTTEDNLYITTDMNDYTISIFTVSGQEVKSFSSMSLDQNISIEELKAGIYFIRIYSRSDSETIRIVKI